MMFEKKYIHYDPIFDEIDEISNDCIQDCAYQYFDPVILNPLLYSVKYVNLENKKTKCVQLENVYRGKNILLKRIEKARDINYVAEKINRLTITLHGTINDLNTCYYLKSLFLSPPLKRMFYSKIATNYEYKKSYCPDNVKYVCMYFYNKAAKTDEYNDLCFRYKFQDVL